jgi:hypothetical protein
VVGRESRPSAHFEDAIVARREHQERAAQWLVPRRQ